MKTRTEKIEDLATHETFLAQLAAEAKVGIIAGEWAGFYNRRVLELSDLGPIELERRFSTLNEEIKE